MSNQKNQKKPKPQPKRPAPDKLKAVLGGGGPQGKKP
jgi:hypothetical protein